VAGAVVLAVAVAAGGWMTLETNAPPGPAAPGPQGAVETVATIADAQPVPSPQPDPAPQPARAPAAPPVAQPASPAPPAAEAAPAQPIKAATGNGTVRLAIKPWAEIRVGGVKRGVSPPLKELALPAGRHTIELRNPAAAPVTRTIEVQPGRPVTLKHQF